MLKTIRMGDQGPEVSVCQAALNVLPSGMPRLPENGLFGVSTGARVREFQTQYQLPSDGVVGAQTWTRLLSPSSGISASATRVSSSAGTQRVIAGGAQRVAAPPAEAGAPCCDHGPSSLSMLDALAKDMFLLALLLGKKHPQEEMIKYSPPSVMPGNARKVSIGEKGTLLPVYGASIDFDTVLVTTLTGLGGRAFVMAVPAPLLGIKAIQIANVGPSPTPELLLHEFAHVWQSQHSSNPLAYMGSAVANQTLADQVNASAGKKVCSAYAYVTGKPFGEYNVEQIAQQIGKGETSIQAHCRGVAKNVVDPSNEKSLLVLKPQLLGVPNVKGAK